jgi:hypothetical protein
VSILKNLYGFLVDQNYLMGNPWSAVQAPSLDLSRVTNWMALSSV